MKTTSFGYTFRTTPRVVQVEDLEKSWLRPAWARFWEMRVGKGVATVYEMDALAELTGRRRFLVVCPKRVIEVWQDAVVTHAKHLRVSTVLDKGANGPPPTETPLVWVVNYERVWSRDERGRRIVRPDILQWRPDLVVADEAHLIKNRTAGRSRALHILGRAAPMRRALTGTPDPRAYGDFWSIYQFLDPTVFGPWGSFAEEYLIQNFWKQVVGYRNVDKLAAKVHSLASRARRADYFDIPEVEDQVVNISLPPAVRRVYQDMAKDLYAELSAQPKETISAPIALTKLLRLAQITSGFVMPNEGGGEIKWVHDEKLRALFDVLDSALADAGAQVVVFAKFRPEIAKIEEALKRRHIRAVSLHGDTKDTGAVLRDFQQKRARVLVSQIATGGMGIDLSMASTSVFVSWDFDMAAYQQARDRTWKPGGKITIVHLVAERTVDWTMLSVVKSKIARSALILDNWKSIVGGEEMLKGGQTNAEDART